MITVSPHDYNAAILQVLHGEPNAWVILKPVSKTTNLVGTSNENDIIRVNKITFGGSVGADGKARLDSSGNLKNIRIGGSVTITPRNKDNLYIYSPTIRVEYF